jgi:hypothetical protein
LRKPLKAAPGAGIFELKLDCFGGGGIVAENEELESLRKIYPDLPPDPDDPLSEAIEALERGDYDFGRIERSEAGSKS